MIHTGLVVRGMAIASFSRPSAGAWSLQRSGEVTDAPSLGRPEDSRNEIRD
jgi:hypothetical protein